MAHLRKYSVLELTLNNVDYRIDYLFLRIILHNVIEFVFCLLYSTGVSVGFLRLSVVSLEKYFCNIQQAPDYY